MLSLPSPSAAPWPAGVPSYPTRVRREVALVALAGAALVVVYLEALFRSARLSSLSAWDAWAFWVPKAKAIYFFGGLDEQFFRELANPSYPPLVPALEASAFHFMGSADVVTLNVQFWFFACGFAAAVAGLLAPRVSPYVLWPCIILVLVTPRVVGRNLDPQADFLLDYFFALAALLVALWLVDREPWLLATASVFMAGAAHDEARGTAARRLRRRRGSGRVLAPVAIRVAAPGARGGRRGCRARPVAHLVLVARPDGRSSLGGSAGPLPQLRSRVACLPVRGDDALRLRPLACRHAARRASA